MPKTESKLQKVNYDEKAESFVPDEEKDKFPEKQLNEVELGKNSE